MEGGVFFCSHYTRVRVRIPISRVCVSCACCACACRRVIRPVCVRVGRSCSACNGLDFEYVKYFSNYFKLILTLGVRHILDVVVLKRVRFGSFLPAWWYTWVDK